MTTPEEFFFSSRRSVVRFDCLEIAHPDFTQTYRIVRNAPSGLVVTDGDPLTEWVFDGVSDEIAFGDVLDMTRTTARSAFAWLSAETYGRAVLGKQSAANNAGWRWTVSANVDQDLILCGPGGAQQIQVGADPRPPADGTEHHIGWTFDGTSDAAGVTMYQDGSAQGKTVGTNNLTSASLLNAEPLQIGQRGSSAPFDGKIRHVTIWNRELTAGEVSELYNGGEPPEVSALSFFGDCILWVKLDETDTTGSGGVTDHSGTAASGTANFSPTVTLPDESTYDYYPARVLPIASSDDLVQSLAITLGDVGDVIATEIAAVWEANGMETRPTLTYRAYRSDDLSAPITGSERVLEIVNVTTSRDGATFEAQAPELNANRTGELYDLERFPMLRGFG